MALTKISRSLLDTGVSDSSDATAITIASDEKVGIGTASPAKTLHISSADAQVLRVESSHAYSGIEIKGSGSSTLPPLISALGDDLLVYGGDSGSRVNVAKFASDGSFQIGAASIANLKFSQSSDVISITAKKDGTDDVDLAFLTQASGGTTAERMRISSSGVLGIGTSSPSTGKLHIDANANHGAMIEDIGGGYTGIIFRASDASTTYLAGTFQRLNGTSVGYIAVGSASTEYNTSGSDLSFKENIKDWNENVLNSFKNIKPVTFNFKSDETKEEIKGYIAQNEVDKFPEAYPINPNDGKHWFNPSGMTVYLMKAIQELSAKVEELESKINE